MSGSRASRPVAAAILVVASVAGASVAGSGAFAQGGAAPFRLMPVERPAPAEQQPGAAQAPGSASRAIPSAGTPAGGAVPAPPVVTDPAAPAATPSRPAPQAKEGIEVNRLAEIDPETFGVLDARAGGLGVDLWDGAARAHAAALLRALPGDVRSRAAHDLMRRLLLSNARAPAGPAVEPSLAAARIERLIAAGDLEGALTLARAADPKSFGEPLARARLDAQLLQGDMAAACATARDGIGRFAGSYWQKAMVLCQIIAGERDRAMTGVDLLRDVGEDDKLFFAVAGKMLGYGSGKVDRVADPRPLDLAMLRQAEIALPRSVLGNTGPAVSRAVATAPNADFTVRLEAAERAVAANALAPGALAQMYMAAGTASDSGAKTGDAWTPAVRATLYRAAAAESNRAARAEALTRYWSEAHRHGDARTAMRVGLPLLENLAPSPEFLRLSPSAARALLAAGRETQAQAWYLLQVEWARTDGQANDDAIRLWPLLKLADAEGRVADSEESLLRWRDLARTDDAEHEEARALLLFMLLDAVGEAVPDSAWAALAPRYLAAQGGVSPGPLALRTLASAREASRGEVIAAALIASEGVEELRRDAAALHAAIRGLVAAGLEKEARQIAVEAAVAAGL